MGKSNVSSRRLSDEECRILIAADEDRLVLNKSGRWEIEDEERPDRRARQSLTSRLLIRHSPLGVYRISREGREALDEEFRLRREERKS